MITRKKFVVEWVKDLRSTNIRQGSGRLSRRSVEGQVVEACCLGIACLTGQRLGIKGSQFGEDQSCFGAWPGAWFIDLMRTHNPQILIKSEVITCIDANDEKHYSFNEIANALEATYLR